MWRPYRELHIGEFLRKIKIAKAKAEEWDLLADTKYAELALVADHTLVSTTHTATRSTQHLLQLSHHWQQQVNSKHTVTIQLLHALYNAEQRDSSHKTLVFI